MLYLCSEKINCVLCFWISYLDINESSSPFLISVSCIAIFSLV